MQALFQLLQTLPEVVPPQLLTALQTLPCILTRAGTLACTLEVSVLVSFPVLTHCPKCLSVLSMQPERCSNAQVYHPNMPELTTLLEPSALPADLYAKVFANKFRFQKHSNLWKC